MAYLGAYMRHSLIILLIIGLLASFGPPLAAQDGPSDTVFFGWQDTTGELLAYSPAGATASLLTIDLTFPPRAWRLSESRALAVLSTAADTGVYELSLDGARRLDSGPNVARFLSLDLRIVAQAPGQVVLAATQGAFAVGLLVDLLDGDVTLLSGESYILPDNWRFTPENVIQLRYISRNNREENTWALRERDIITDEETVLHTFEAPFPVFSASADGLHWVYRTTTADGFVYTRILPDGTAETLDEFPPGEAVPVQYTAYGETLWRYETPCPADCTLSATPLAGGDVVSYPAPALPGGSRNFLARPTPERVLIRVDAAFWLLEADTPPRALGRVDGETLTTDGRLTDGRWLLAAVPEGLTLFDLTAADPAAPLVPPVSMGAVAIPVITPVGVIVLGAVAEVPALRYVPGDAAWALLPQNEAGFFIRPLGDGTVLYAQTREADGRPAGIYRYNPADGVYILVLQNIFPLSVQPVP